MVWLSDSEKKIEGTITLFDKIHKCDKQTDGQTDIKTHGQLSDTA